jgi:hypothetical protein
LRAMTTRYRRIVCPISIFDSVGFRS